MSKPAATAISKLTHLVYLQLRTVGQWRNSEDTQTTCHGSPSTASINSRNIWSLIGKMLRSILKTPRLGARRSLSFSVKKIKESRIAANPYRIIPLLVDRDQRILHSSLSTLVDTQSFGFETMTQRSWHLNRRTFLRGTSVSLSARCLTACLLGTNSLQDCGIVFQWGQPSTREA